MTAGSRTHFLADGLAFRQKMPTSHYPLAELSERMLDYADGSVINLV